MPKTIILVANTDWYLYNFRKQLIISLTKEDHNVVVISPSGSYVEKLEELGAVHYHWNVGRQSINPIYELQSILELRKIYHQLSPALIHQHTLKTVIYGNFSRKGLNIPIVNSVPGRGYVYSSDSIKARLLRPILDFLIKNSLTFSSQQLIFENIDDMNYFVEKGFAPIEKMKLIPSVGVDIEYFIPKPIPSGESMVVGFVGRMLWNKGVGFFVEAAKILGEIKSNVKMVLVGLPDPGNPESVSQNQIDEWVRDEIVDWWGWQADMPEIYNKLHVLAFPTNYGEGVPTVLLEAGACKRAVIASDTPGCRELIEDGKNGFLIKTESPKSLVEKILLLAENESTYQELRNNLYNKVIQHFNTTTINEQTIEIYNQLLGEKELNASKE